MYAINCKQSLFCWENLREEYNEESKTSVTASITCEPQVASLNFVHENLLSHPKHRRSEHCISNNIIIYIRVKEMNCYLPVLFD